MTRLLVILAISLPVLPATAFGEPAREGQPAVGPIEVKAEGHLGTPQQQRACRQDVLRYCRDKKDDHAMADCLISNEQKLSSACRRVLDSNGK